MRLLPPPTVKSVPEAQPPPSCMPEAEDEGAGDDRDAGRRDRAAQRLTEHGCRRKEREEHDAGHRQHQHLRAQPGASPIADEHAATTR